MGLKRGKEEEMDIEYETEYEQDDEDLGIMKNWIRYIAFGVIQLFVYFFITAGMIFSIGILIEFEKVVNILLILQFVNPLATILVTKTGNFKKVLKVWIGHISVFIILMVVSFITIKVTLADFEAYGFVSFIADVIEYIGLHALRISAILVGIKMIGDTLVYLVVGKIKKIIEKVETGGSRKVKDKTELKYDQELNKDVKGVGEQDLYEDDSHVEDYGGKWM